MTVYFTLMLLEYLRAEVSFSFLFLVYSFVQEVTDARKQHSLSVDNSHRLLSIAKQRRYYFPRIETGDHLSGGDGAATDGLITCVVVS